MNNNCYEYHFDTKIDWLEKRGIGGSDASSLKGESKWQTLNQLYDRLVKNEITDKDVNDRMLEGSLAEQPIRDLFKLEHPEYRLEEPPKKGYWLFREIDQPLITLTPDGLLNDRTGFLEIKDVEVISKKELEMWHSGVLPSQYYNQILWYFVVINTLTFGILHARIKVMNYDSDTKKLSFDHVEEFDYTILRKDYQKDIKELKAKAIDFIEKNVKPRVRPVVKFKL